MSLIILSVLNKIVLMRISYECIIFTFKGVLKYESMKRQASTLVLSSCIIVALPANGLNYQPKHVIVNVIHK